MLSAHAEEFDFDARSGWLAQRLELLARLGRYRTALRMVEEYPEYADLFTNAPEPDTLARVIRELALDRQDTARLLNLFIGWSSPSEIARLQRVLEYHGTTVMLFAGSVHLQTVAEALVLSYAEGAPRAWNGWLASEFRTQAREGRLEDFIATVETQGRAIARRMESTPGFDGEFPYLWRQFRELVERSPTEEDRMQMLSGLLSHEGVWETLAEPHGARALTLANDWVPVLLLTLWGTEGWTQPPEAEGPLFEHWQPMPTERRAWLLHELASDSEARRSLGEIGAVLHHSDAFWAIALDLERADLLDCSLRFARQQSDWDGSEEVPAEFLDRLTALSAISERALRRMCSAPPSILVRALPGYYSVKLIGDLWAGVPIGAGDVVSTGSELYLPARYAVLLGRGARFARPEAVGLGARMSLDHLLTQRMALGHGQRNAVAPRPVNGRPRNYVLIQNGWLAPVPRGILAQGGLFMTRETLQNLAAEGLLAGDFSQRVILHFRCAGPFRMEDPRCQ